MFKIPQKQMIVNSDDQLRLLNGTVASDGTPGDPYDGYAVPVVGDTFILEGLLPELALGDLQDLPDGNKVTKETAVAAVQQIATFTVTSSSNSQVFRIVFDSLDGTPTDFQNQPVSKIYQLSPDAAVSNATEVGDAVVAAIDADQDAMCTASNAAGVVTLTAKDFGVTFKVYVDPVVSDLVGVFAVTTPAVAGTHTYGYLKNIEWSKNLDFDRNQEYQPLKGATYVMYTFQFDSVGFVSGNNHVPGALNPTSRNTVKLWVASTASTLVTALDALQANANAI